MAMKLDDSWSDERKLSACIAIATAERLREAERKSVEGKVPDKGRWLLGWELSDEEHDLIRAGRAASANGESPPTKRAMPAGMLGKALSHALNRALQGLRDFPAAGQPTDDPEARRFPLEALPYTLFYRENRAHGGIDVLAIKREATVHRLGIAEWMEANL
jgi:hypothetical protein